MKTYFKTVNEILENEKECPFPISVIPNNMGINLCSVDAISWQKQEDGQLTSLTVHFLPNEVDKLKLSDRYTKLLRVLDQRLFSSKRLFLVNYLI